MKRYLLLLTGCFVSFIIVGQKTDYLELSQEMLNKVYLLYAAPSNELLLNETSPFNPENVATYTANQDRSTKQRVAYLWPTSGMFSGVVSLLKVTSDIKYKELLDSRIIPGLNLYWDDSRSPACYQSYLKSEGKSDRFYDDNIWLVIDFAEAYLLTKDSRYLTQAQRVWQFVISGWDDKLGGGIYWCEQKKESKNTCSNAPAVVAAAKLYQATGDKTYLEWSCRIYDWTKSNLLDTTDYLYWDNKSLSGRMDKKKYPYNSGQMLQGAALLYKITQQKSYLDDANRIAANAIDYFTVTREKNGTSYRLFNDRGAWFTTVMIRGYIELYEITKERKQIEFFKSTLDYMLTHARYENGLFYGDWSGEKENRFKWLLDQACIIELAAQLSAF